MSLYKIFFLCILQHLFVIEVLSSWHQEITLSTDIGTFIGNIDTVTFDGDSKHVQRYLGIPYAKPPLGERRFARPEPFGTFSDVYNATFHRPHCIQVIPPFYKHLEGMVKSEDCLHLNIYVPGNTTSKNNSLAVMLYIYGGSFAIGGADIYSGDILSAFNDVIVVTINYRLNVFGFLSNGTKSSGNYGLWDMRMAIQWVHAHINKFGGDPSRVTLFGNSAGGAAAMYQAIYPQNKGLFQRIVAQSGTILSFWAFQKNPTDVFASYIKDTNCDLSDYDQIIECLRSKSVKQLLTESWSFLPSVDRDFLHKDPSSILSDDSLEGKSAQKFFAEIDVIIGVAGSDGAVNVPIWEEELKEKQIDIKTGVPRSYFENVKVPEIITTVFGKTSPMLTESVIHQYTDWTRPDDALTTRRNMVDLASDSEFFLPAINSIQRHSNIVMKGRKSTSFFYVFDQKPSFVPYPDWLEGATHTMEVAYVFGLHESLERKLVDDLGGVDPFKVTQDDIKLSAQMMTLWSNFAKSGDPSSPVTATSFEWPQYNTNEQKYLNIVVNMTSQSVKHHLAATRIAFWQELAPVLQRCNTEQITSNAPYSSVHFTTSVSVILYLWKLFF